MLYQIKNNVLKFLNSYVSRFLIWKHNLLIRIEQKLSTTKNSVECERHLSTKDLIFFIIVNWSEFFIKQFGNSVKRYPSRLKSQQRFQQHIAQIVPQDISTLPE